MLSPQQIQELNEKYGRPQTGGNFSGGTPATPENLAIEMARIKNIKAGLPAGKGDQSFFQDLAGDVKSMFSNLGRTYKRTQEKIGKIGQANIAGEQGYARSFGQTAGTIAGGISQGFGDIFIGAIKAALPQAGEDYIKQKVAEVVPIAIKIDEAIGSPIGNLMESYENLDEKSKRDVDALMGIAQLATDLAGSYGVKKVGQIGLARTADVASDVARGIGSVSDDVVRAGQDIIPKSTKKIMGLVSPEPKPLKAVGEILQGESGLLKGDIKKGLQSIASIDVNNIKTQENFFRVINSKISDLADKVDADLAVDTTKRTINDLAVSATTKAGTKVVTNPVETALNHLDELYEKIGEAVKSAEIKDLINIAKKEGLTNLEINDIARVYGQEFGSKAFSKMGDPLTSVNAQLYENIRKSLKDLARGGIKGTEAQKADQIMTSLYNTRRLVEKNVKEVNKLKNKIREMGLFEKVGHTLSKYGDVLTGGTIRGFVGGLLPRGVGNKTMNALDIEKHLQKNLKIIKEAIESGSDTEIMKIIKKLDTPN